MLKLQLLNQQIMEVIVLHIWKVGLREADLEISSDPQRSCM